MNIDGMVRETLHSYADEAPSSAGLLDGAHARAHRRRARHAGAAVAVGTAAVTLAVAIPLGLSGDGPAVPGSGPPPVALAPASFELPSFPFTPRWVPDGTEPPYVARSPWFAREDVELYYYGPDGLRSEEAELRWLEQRAFPVLSLVHPAGPDEIGSPLRVEIYAAEPDLGLESLEGEPTTVLGRPGTRYTGEEGNVMVVWQHEPDQWVRLWAAADITPADVERYLQELEETPLPGQAPFTFGLLPVDVEVTGLSADEMYLDAPDGVGVTVTLTWNEQTVGPVLYSPTPTGEPPVDPSGSPDPSSSPVDPTVGPSGSPAPQPTPIDVGGRPATLTDWGTGTSVDISLEQDWILAVSGPLNREDLLAIAEGVELEPWARPFGLPAQPR
jgi:hypothetical protein